MEGMLRAFVSVVVNVLMVVVTVSLVVVIVGDTVCFVF